MKSYAEAYLREIAANRIIAFVIWEVGVPRIACAADQEGAPAAEQRADALQEKTIAILDWLDGAARSILRYMGHCEVPGGAAQSRQQAWRLWPHANGAGTKGRVSESAGRRAEKGVGWQSVGMWFGSRFLPAESLCARWPALSETRPFVPAPMA